MRENAETKARRHLVEGRLEVQSVETGTVLAGCLGDEQRALGRRSPVLGVLLSCLRATLHPRSGACASRQEAEMTQFAGSPPTEALPLALAARIVREAVKDKAYRTTPLGLVVGHYMRQK
jgi:hypothetical protein